MRGFHVYQVVWTPPAEGLTDGIPAEGLTAGVPAEGLADRREFAG